jgi:AcrR family transcriptional regulator
MAGTRKTRAEQRIETRGAIIATAARLFLKQGIEATSIDAVAARLGLTKGAVYANFRSKLELVEAVAVANSRSAGTMGVLVEPLPLAERLRRFGRELVIGRFSRDLVLLDLEYVIYAARNRRWARDSRRRRQASLSALAARFRAVNRAQGDRLPLDEERFLELLVLVGRGIIQKLTVDPGSLRPADVHAMIALLGRRRAPAPAAAREG